MTKTLLEAEASPSDRGETGPCQMAPLDDRVDDGTEAAMLA